MNWGGGGRRAFDLCFPTDKVGYAVGFEQGKGAAVWKTTDAGEKWEALPFTSDVGTMRRCSFISAREGWICGDSGQVWHTQDGGQTWERCPAPFLSNQRVTGVVFFPGGEGFASATVPFVGGRLAAEVAIAYTPDGGKTWQPAVTGWKSVSAMFFLDRGHGWACGVSPGFGKNSLVALYAP